jgi:hypothetical protein
VTAGPGGQGRPRAGDRLRENGGADAPPDAARAEAGDPAERAAAGRLQQAIRRIQANRERHQPRTPGRIDPSNLERKRDW